MPLHTPDGGYVAPEYADLDRKLKQGDGILWPGDERLYLGIGVLTDPSTGRTARRLEVWRYNEDGSETIVSTWHPKDQMMVLYDLAQMRVETPGHVDAITAIDKHNEAMQKAASDEAVGQMFEVLEHAVRLDHDRENPRNRFYMNDIKEPAAKPTKADEAA